MPRAPSHRPPRTGGSQLWTDAELAVLEAMYVRLQECLPGRTGKAITVRLKVLAEERADLGALEHA